MKIKKHLSTLLVTSLLVGGFIGFGIKTEASGSFNTKYQLLSPGEVNLYWDQQPISGNYWIYRDSVLLGKVPAGYVSSFWDEEATPGTHVYRIDAIDTVTGTKLLDSESITVNTKEADEALPTSFKIGNRTASVNASFVKIGGVVFRPLADNYLISSKAVVESNWLPSNWKKNDFSNSGLDKKIENTWLPTLNDTEYESLKVTSYSAPGWEGNLITNPIVDERAVPPTMKELLKYSNLYDIPTENLNAGQFVRDKMFNNAITYVYGSSDNIHKIRVHRSTSSSFPTALVITLKSSTKLSGEGTSRNPYTISSVGPENPSLQTPNGLKLVSSKAGHTSFSWDIVEKATSYIVKRDGIDIGTVSTTVFEDSSTVAGSSYNYTITAKGTDGSSSQESASLKIDVQAPPVLKAPANFKELGKTHNSVLLGWDAVVGATSYQLTSDGSVAYEGSNTQINISSLSPGDYTFKVKAISDGISGPESIVKVSIKENTLDYPIGLSVTNATYNTISLKWNSVNGAESYIIQRDGVEVGRTTNTNFSDENVQPGAQYDYGVMAINGSIKSENSKLTVTVPTKPIEGLAPGIPSGFKVTRAYADKVKLQWATVSDATYYDLIRDSGTLVYRGPLTAITDETTGPEESYTYHIIAANQFGKSLPSSTIAVTTPAEAPAIVVSPSPVVEGTITFKFNMVEGAQSYKVERNPEVTYDNNGNGTFHLTYFNTVTGETRDYGNVTPIDNKLPFYETGVDPGKDYHYEITAIRMSSLGIPEVIGKSEVSINTPSDGSGVTIPAEEDSTQDKPGDKSKSKKNKDSHEDVISNNSTGKAITGSSGCTLSSVKNSISPDSSKRFAEITNAPQSTVSESTYMFTDLTGNFAEQAVYSLAKHGTIIGYEDGTFGPDKKISRAEFAIMLTRAMKYSSDEGYVNNFKDFDMNTWYSKELAVALNNKVTKGFDKDTYKPNSLIPREQAAVMVANIMRTKMADNGNEILYTDKNNIIDWARSDVLFTSSLDIFNGYSDGTFLPKRQITRAEAAVVIYRMLSKINNK